WNNDYLTDLLLAGAGGLRFLQQTDITAFAFGHATRVARGWLRSLSQDNAIGYVDVTARTGLGPVILTGDYYGAWAADIEMAGQPRPTAGNHRRRHCRRRRVRPACLTGRRCHPTADGQGQGCRLGRRRVGEVARSSG